MNICHDSAFNVNKVKFWNMAIQLDVSLMDSYEDARDEWYGMWNMYKERKYLEQAAHKEQLRLAQVAKIREIVFNQSLTLRSV